MEVGGQGQAPAILIPGNGPGTHCTGGWLGPRAGLEIRRKSRPIGIRFPDHPASSELLHRLSYPGPRRGGYKFLNVQTMVIPTHTIPSTNETIT